MITNDLKEKMRVLKRIINFSVESDKNRKKILMLGVIVGILREGTFLAGTFLPTLIIQLIINRENISFAIILSCAISASVSIIDFVVESILRRISNLSVSSISYKILRLNQKYMTMRYDLINATATYDKYDKAVDAVWEVSDTEYIIYSQLVPKIFSLASLITVFINIDLLAAIVVCVSMIVEMLLGRNSEAVDFEARERIANRERKFSHILSNLLDPVYSRDLKAYVSENFFSKQIEQYRCEYIEEIGGREKRKLKYSILSSVNVFAQLMVIYILALFNFAQKAVPLGAFLLYISASSSFFDTMQQIKNDILYLDRVISYYKDIETFESDEDSPQVAAPLECNKKNITTGSDIPEIEFINVSFTYPNQFNKALDNVSIKIYPKEKISLVGENGSGKSTLVKLLLKLYKPDEGMILVNGKDISKIDDEVYFRYYSPVFQDFQLLSYTIKENIAFDCDDDEGVLNSLDKSKLKQKVLGLPKGINTFYTSRFDENGIEFSGGEEQLLALSRALYKDAPIMILDEPTSALDPLREEEIYDLFSSQSRDKTVIYISHRMSASCLANRIILLKNGKVCEVGTHNELMQTNGEYSQLWNMQSQWYK